MNVKNKIGIAVMMSAGVVGSAWGVTVNLTPGTLQGKLPTLSADNELVLTGLGDIRDLNAVRDLGQQDLKILDMSNMEITSLISEAPTHLGKSVFKANHLPSYSLFQVGYETVKLPKCLTVIEDGALAGSRIEEIEIPEGVTTLGAYAFYGCENLKVVTLPTTLTTIGRSAFGNCPQLEFVNLGDTRVKILPEECFSGDISLTMIDAPEVTTVGSRAMAGSGIESLNLPQASLLSPFALADMHNLIVLTIAPDAKFSEGVLMNCESLMSVNGAPEQLPDLFAANCRNLPAGEIVKQATVIGRYSLANTGMSEIVLGSGLTSIQDNAFKGSTTLSYIDAQSLKERVPDVAEDSFAGLEPSDITLHVADELITDWKSHPVWGEFNITSNGTTGVTDIAGDTALGIKIAVSGNTLLIESDEPILSGAIYDMNGRQLMHFNASGNTISADISALPSGVNLVSVRTTTQFKGVKLIL